jgi:hypothetical protein
VTRQWATQPRSVRNWAPCSSGTAILRAGFAPMTDWPAAWR